MILAPCKYLTAGLSETAVETENIRSAICNGKGRLKRSHSLRQSDIKVVIKKNNANYS